MLRLCLKPPTWSLLRSLSLLQSILHSTATMIYLKTVSTPGPFSVSQAFTLTPHCLQSTISACRGGIVGTWAGPHLPLQGHAHLSMPTMPCHTQDSHNLPAVPPTSRLLPTDTLLSPPSRVSLPFFSWEWKHPQHRKGGTMPPGSHLWAAKLRPEMDTPPLRY